MMLRRSLVPALSFFALAFAWQQLRRLVKAQPHYSVERRVGPVEIRAYEPRVVAHTEATGEFIGALHEGYARLARFAHGENESHTNVVASEPVSTSPATGGANTEYVIALEMPARHEPPRPSDARVRIDTMPSRRVAALRFRGVVSAARVRAHADRLLAVIRNEGLLQGGETSFATYDPPTVLPLLRRNEVWVELA